MPKPSELERRIERRRDTIDIYADILRAIARGCKRTHIVYKANLNFNRCKRHMADLFKGELVEIKSSSPSTWEVTDKGREFLEKYEELMKMCPRPEVLKHGLP